MGYKQEQKILKFLRRTTLNWSNSKGSTIQTIYGIIYNLDRIASTTKLKYDNPTFRLGNIVGGGFTRARKTYRKNNQTTSNTLFQIPKSIIVPITRKRKKRWEYFYN